MERDGTDASERTWLPRNRQCRERTRDQAEECRPGGLFQQPCFCRQTGVAKPFLPEELPHPQP